jgi:hypothetical protein
LDLNEIRRRYYGKSAEYPTTAQRIAMIQKVYEETVGMDAFGGDLSEFKPLAPHRDIAQTDYNLFLDEFRKVRAFRQTLLSSIDQLMASLLKKQHPLEQIASTFVVLVEQQKDILKGTEKKEALNELIQLVSGVDDKSLIDVSAVKSMLEKAGIGEYARAMFLDLLQQNPVDWIQIAGYLSILEKAPKQFLYGLTYDYLLANTALRWHPDAFVALQAVLPEMEVKAKQLKPYRLDQPLRGPLPTFEQRVKVLKTWNGRYIRSLSKEGLN